MKGVASDLDDPALGRLAVAKLNADQFLVQTAGHRACLGLRVEDVEVLAVLNAADFPSVLAEVGFLSSERDRVALSSSAGRAPIVAGIVTAIGRWALDEAARAPLIRQ